VSERPEYLTVERPFIDQLRSMGWQHAVGNVDDPTKNGRESFGEVLLPGDLRNSLRRINLDLNGNEWLDDARITQAINALRRLGASRLLEANQKATDLLLKGTVVDGVEGWDQGRGRTVHFIDWEHPENNTFRVINQFRVDEPGGQAKKFVTPDLVLFVNGVPLVVVECKSPGVPEPIEQAIDQLQRYSNQREWVNESEGNERLFHTNQIVVATSFDEARAGTISSEAVHFLEWKDTSPEPMAEVAAALGKTALSSQEKLVAGMLRPANLLDIVRHFTLFQNVNGRTVKIVGRYQQFRAVQRAVQRMLTGKTRLQDGEHDRRGGIIWHTQGSGKSLAMVFLVRKMRSHRVLRRFKIVFVTDRKDLQKQLSDTATLTDETLTIVKPERRGQRTVSALEVLKNILRQPGKDLVFAMIQKYRAEDVLSRAEFKSSSEPLPLVAEAAERYGGGDTEDEAGDAEVIPGAVDAEEFLELNTSDDILVMVDEAHRSHTNTMHANLLRALPNCVRIGFTGTPIIMGAKKRTHEIFGEFIDRYTIKQSEADGSTVPILYEGRTSEGAVKDGRSLDQLFEDMLAERTPEELEAIKRKYATKGNVMEAPALIAAKASNMLRHYVQNILPNGFKAQVVAVSRRAAIRYYDALMAARAELVAALEGLEPALRDLPDDQVQLLDAERAFLVRAYPFLPLIRALEFAPVISGNNNDDPTWREWTDPNKIEARIARFKRPLPDDLTTYDPAKADPLAFLIVKSMLITGFDAPVEQVMYLDRHIQEAELLQAIARVNRTCGQKKRAGLVVDYYGVARHLKDTLAAYSAEDIDGALRSLKDDVPRLRDRHQRVLGLFADRGVAVVSRLSEWERRRLTEIFSQWDHPNVGDHARAASLGEGSVGAAAKVLDVLERLLACSTPGETDDPYVRLHEKTVSAIRAVLSASPRDDGELMDAAEKLVLQVEPFVYKLLAVLEPAAYAEMKEKKKGLDVGIRVLMEHGRSRYRLKLTPEEFASTEGWDARTSYENAIHDVMGARLDAAHRSVKVAPHLWRSTLAVMLGMVDENLEELQRLPKIATPDSSSYEGCVELLRDERLRAEFQVKLRQFLESLDLVLPRPEALPFVSDAKALAFVQARARNRYRSGERPIGREVGEKVRKLIDDHIISLGIDPKIPPIEITDARFDEHVSKQKSPRTRASEMEHALRYHIRRHFDEDPVRYETLSQRLKQILEDLEERWDELVAALAQVIKDAVAGRRRDETGLDPETQLPFLAVLQREVTGNQPIEGTLLRRLCEVTVEVVEHIQQEVRLVGFWQNANAQDVLRKWIVQYLDDQDGLVEFDRLEAVSDRLLELARANHHRLVR
jgi:type I restriction enzyme, R subunit